MRHWIAAIVVLTTAAATFAQHETEIPLKRITLFTSGVGYFEHTGPIEGDATTRLMFQTDQINDVLKSMVIHDADAEATSTVTYASDDPLDRVLESFAVDLSWEPDLGDLLQAQRGAEIQVSAPDVITGKILGVEYRNVLVDENDDRVVKKRFITLVTEDGLRTLPLDSVDNVRFTDPKLRDELNKALAALVSSRDVDRKPVSIRLNGHGQRQARIGYLVETPVWKTSYRLDLSAEKAFLQGWAIVENTSETDWQHVELSLVSGRPISFVMELYTPLYLERPVVVPEMMASLRPQEYEEGNNGTMLFGDAGGGRPRTLGERESNRKAAAFMVAPAEEASAQVMQQNMVAASAAGSVGELFRYTIKEPVDMPRHKSAMLPIIARNVTTEKVSIYNQSVQSKHPLNGAYLTNDTGLKMLGGPVTVFDGNTYAGDAQIDHLAPKDKRLLSYAVDLEVRVDPSQKAASSIAEARITRGVLVVTRKYVYDQTYAIDSNAAVDRTVIVEHPFNASRKLVEPTQPWEKTPQLYRFRVKVPAQGSEKLTVREEMTQSQTIALMQQNPDSLVWYTKSGEISDKVRNALAKAIALKRELAEFEKQLATLEQQLAGIKQGQSRLRENLKAVDADSTLGKRYIRILDEQENQIEQLEGEQIPAAREQVQAKQRELADYLENLVVS